MTTKSFVDLKRKLESGALKMTEQDVDILRIDETHFRWLRQEILRVIDDVLIQRRTGCNQYRHRCSTAPAGTTHALPGRRDSSRISGENGNIETSDVHTEFQSIRR